MMNIEKKISMFLIIAMLLTPFLAYNVKAVSHVELTKSIVMDDYKKACQKEDQKETQSQKTSCSSVDFFGFAQLFSNLIMPRTSVVVLALLLISIGIPPIYRLFKPPCTSSL